MFRKERTKNIRTSHPERCQGLDAAPCLNTKNYFTGHWHTRWFKCEGHLCMILFFICYGVNVSDKICFLKKVLDKKELNSMRNQMKDHRISCVTICSTSEQQRTLWWARPLLGSYKYMTCILLQARISNVDSIVWMNRTLWILCPVVKRGFTYHLLFQQGIRS